MTPGSRRGFTLIELLVALILLVLVGGSMYRVLNTVQRVTGKQTQSAAIQGNLRSGAQLIQSELQEISTNSGDGTSDIISMAATLFRYRAARGIGISCGTPTTTNLKIRASSYSGLREPKHNRDQVWIFWDKDSLVTTDDKWSPADITGVGSTTCPDGAAAYDLTLSGMVVPAGMAIAHLEYIANVPAAGEGPIPVRIYETMEVGQVNDAGQEWLGIRSVSGSETTLVPVVGPLDATGVSFLYYQKDGGAAGSVNAVTSIQILLRVVSARNVNTKMDGTIGALSDSITIRAQLRNSQ